MAIEIKIDATNDFGGKYELLTEIYKGMLKESEHKLLKLEAQNQILKGIIKNLEDEIVEIKNKHLMECSRCWN